MHTARTTEHLEEQPKIEMANGKKKQKTKTAQQEQQTLTTVTSARI